MDTRTAGRGLSLIGAALVLASCGLVLPGWEAEAPGPHPTPPGPRGRLPEKFESPQFIVTFARPGDTPKSLAARHLGDPDKAWMIEDFNGVTRFKSGQEVVIPRQEWNPSGVEPGGYQLVPVLVYHDIAPTGKGRLVIAAKTFEQHMRYLKNHGYRVVTVEALHDFVSRGRQLPRRSVVLTFDDGHRSFVKYARPVLKALGFAATLFVSTDFIGRDGSVLTWEELAALTADDSSVEVHAKSHADLRRRPRESGDEYARRMRAELEAPQRLFEQRFGRPPRFLAYRYGAVDDTVVEHVRRRRFVAGLTLAREGTPLFASLFRIRRTPVYADMAFEDFVRALNTFAEEAIK